MNISGSTILDEMVEEVLEKGIFNPETDNLLGLYDLLSKELPA